MSIYSDNNPCRHCLPPKRHAECHSNCAEYKAWRATVDGVIEKRRDLLSNQRALDSIEKIRRKRRRYRRRN